ncbi:uncharacterized protein [Rutidosis leptorrhynchoides]|uniref:uncharacterized protein isoform X5 n=1 Tax=Rutidosis leptorrhynchoides TaxID=125765 RepID=UPI003A98FBFF
MALFLFLEMCVSYRYLWMIGLGSYYRRCSVMLVTRVYGFGGLSVVAQLVNQTVLDPETQSVLLGTELVTSIRVWSGFSCRISPPYISCS